MNLSLLRGLPFTDRVLYYPRVDSTRSVAARAVARGDWEPSLILTDFQTAGRGTQGRTWFSPSGKSLLVSILTHPLEGIGSAGLAGWLAETLAATVQEEAGVPAEVKPPNDVRVEGQKLGGVLAEVLHGSSGEAWILSFGLNVNVETFPENLGQPATSLYRYTGKTYSREAVLGAFLNRFTQMA